MGVHQLSALPDGAQAEIDETTLCAMFVDQNVVEFEVPVHDPPGVKVAQGRTQLGGQPSRLVLGQVAAAAALGQHLVEGSRRRKVLQCEADEVVDGHDLQEPDDVGVVQPAQDASFSHEILPCVVVSVRFVFVDDFERHFGIQ